MLKLVLKMKYYTKFIFYLIMLNIVTSIFIPLMFLKPRDYRNGLLPSWGTRQIAKALGLKWQIKGKKNIIQDEGTVVLINHQSSLDMMILAEIWPVLERCTVISKQEVFFFWPFGLAAWLWGTVFINRSKNKEAQEAINEVASVTINKKKAKILMFPEGTRHQGEKLLPFKKGAFHIAIASQAPIQPLVVSQYRFLDHKKFRFDAGSPIISILPAIPTAGLKKENIEELIEKTYTVMSNEYEMLNKES